MEKEQAINVLIQVAQLAQSKGVLSLQEATIVFQAMTTLAPQQETEQIKTEEQE